MPTIKSLLERPGPLIMPGVYDALGAKIAQKTGFEALFQTGYGTSASMLAMPDYGFIGAAETIENARRICTACQIPVIVDADTGYGNALSVWKTVRHLEGAGAAGIFLEDQRWPKRCGHMRGKETVPYEEYAEKLRAAIDARQNDDFVIVARTDARATVSLDEAISRGIQNSKAGADIIFVEAPQSIDELKEIASKIDAPLVANMIEGGATPNLPADELYKIGFKIILYPLSALFASTYAVSVVMKELKETGTTDRFHKEMTSFAQFNDLVELDRFERLENKYQRKNDSKA